MPTSVPQLALDLASPTAAERIAGVDEAGRGPLAGPVVVAAVVFEPGRTPINGLADSKQLCAERREVLAVRIKARAIAWHIEVVDAATVDRLNIYHATMLGMRACVEAVAHVARVARIDGNALPKGLPCPAEAWIGGDARCRSIMAASILAKTHRDALMTELHAQWPQYGFDQHKGYSTPEHLAALVKYGPCSAHRQTFKPVACARTAEYPTPKRAD
ncbi:ribonuclease HII [Lysobacter humi (ex Lee et al. 2017)]